MKNFAIHNSKSENPKFMAMYEISIENVDKIFESKSHKNWFVTSFLKFEDYQHVTNNVSRIIIVVIH